MKIIYGIIISWLLVQNILCVNSGDENTQTKKQDDQGVTANPPGLNYADIDHGENPSFQYDGSAEEQKTTIKRGKIYSKIKGQDYQIDGAVAGPSQSHYQPILIQSAINEQIRNLEFVDFPQFLFRMKQQQLEDKILRTKLPEKCGDIEGLMKLLERTYRRKRIMTNSNMKIKLVPGSISQQSFNVRLNQIRNQYKQLKASVEQCIKSQRFFKEIQVEREIQSTTTTEDYIKHCRLYYRKCSNLVRQLSKQLKAQLSENEFITFGSIFQALKLMKKQQKIKQKIKTFEKNVDMQKKRSINSFLRSFNSLIEQMIKKLLDQILLNLSKSKRRKLFIKKQVVKHFKKTDKTKVESSSDKVSKNQIAKKAPSKTPEEQAAQLKKLTENNLGKKYQQWKPDPQMAKKKKKKLLKPKQQYLVTLWATKLTEFDLLYGILSHQMRKGWSEGLSKYWQLLVAWEKIKQILNENKFPVNYRPPQTSGLEQEDQLQKEDGKDPLTLRLGLSRSAILHRGSKTVIRATKLVRSRMYSYVKIGQQRKYIPIKIIREFESKCQMHMRLLEFVSTQKPQNKHMPNILILWQSFIQSDQNKADDAKKKCLTSTELSKKQIAQCVQRSEILKLNFFLFKHALHKILENIQATFHPCDIVSTTSLSNVGHAAAAETSVETERQYQPQGAESQASGSSQSKRIEITQSIDQHGKLSVTAIYQKDYKREIMMSIGMGNSDFDTQLQQKYSLKFSIDPKSGIFQHNHWQVNTQRCNSGSSLSSNFRKKIKFTGRISPSFLGKRFSKLLVRLPRSRFSSVTSIESSHEGSAISSSQESVSYEPTAGLQDSSSLIQASQLSDLPQQESSHSRQEVLDQDDQSQINVVQRQKMPRTSRSHSSSIQHTSHGRKTQDNQHLNDDSNNETGQF